MSEARTDTTQTRPPEADTERAEAAWLRKAPRRRIRGERDRAAARPSPASLRRGWQRGGLNRSARHEGRRSRPAAAALGGAAGSPLPRQGPHPGHLSPRSPYARPCRGIRRVRSVIGMTRTTGSKGNGPAVEFTAAVKTFGRAGSTVRAVDGMDLTVGRGETVALLGRNGAGKSTAISLLLGLNDPDSGTVRLLGRAPDRAVRAGLAGAMLQDGRPIPRVTVGELIRFVAALYPRPLPVAEALALAGVTEYADRRVDKLSGGQVQRVRFAVALAGDPELVVLDEPTAALDVEARRAFWVSIRSFAERGRTVLFSTHHLEEADGNADRIVVLHRGRVVADGSGEAIKRSAGGGLVSVDLVEAVPRPGWSRSPVSWASRCAGAGPCCVRTTRTRPSSSWHGSGPYAGSRSAGRLWRTRSSRSPHRQQQPTR